MATQTGRMGFGIFMAPFHALGENPTAALARDVELVELLDRLGYDEAWFGEHHSAGREIIADPVSFMAYVAARTQRIRVGTGVTSLPYHHPLIVADQMVQLDHLTRGRAMLGVGPGALASDAYMMGLDQVQQRRKMNEALDAIMALLRAEGPVNAETDWFTLRDARLQLASYTRPHLPVAVAAVLTPSGPTAAGRHGVGVLSVGGFDNDGFARTWDWAEESAAQAGTIVRREDWRVVAPIHVAETKERALEDIREGFARRAYFGDEGASAKLPAKGRGYVVAAAIGMGDQRIEDAMERGAVLVGSPDDVCEGIQRIQERSGGFGVLLGLAHEWANTERTQHSYELFARYVMPQFQAQEWATRASASWVMENGRAINAQQNNAFKTAFADAGKELPEAIKEGLGDRG